MWNVKATFTATKAFDAWRERFVKKSELSAVLEESEADEDEDLDAFDALEHATSPPSLRLVEEVTGRDLKTGKDLGTRSKAIDGARARDGTRIWSSFAFSRS